MTLAPRQHSSRRADARLMSKQCGGWGTPYLPNSSTHPQHATTRLDGQLVASSIHMLTSPIRRRNGVCETAAEPLSPRVHLLEAEGEKK